MFKVLAGGAAAPRQIFAKFDLLPVGNYSDKKSSKKYINHSKFLESNW